MMHPPTVILRHARENLKKCSLRGLEGRSGLCFYTYPRDPLPDLTGYLLLKVGAEPLTAADAKRGLFLIDGTWRLAQLMEKQVYRALLGSVNFGGKILRSSSTVEIAANLESFQDRTVRWGAKDADENSLDLTARGRPCLLETRSLPPLYRTAYPRKQTHCPDPEVGLSSVEALFLSAKILGRPDEHFLDFYYWKDRFLKLNEFA